MTQTANPSPKINFNNSSTAIPSIQTVYINPLYTGDPKSYSDVYIKFGKFLHAHKILKNSLLWRKNIGRNKISVKFVSTQAANSFISKLVFETAVPTYNIMGLLKGVLVEWSVKELVESLELPFNCGDDALVFFFLYIPVLFTICSLRLGHSSTPIHLAKIRV